MTVVLIATGGTIACTPDSTGALVPTKSAADLAQYIPAPVRAIDFRRLDSCAITTADLDELIQLVLSTAEEEDVERIIITHGTDSLEDTALALSLFSNASIPIILTGAQRPIVDENSDGARNLADSLKAEGAGVLIQFGGVTTHAWGARKIHTTDEVAFGASEADFPAILPLEYTPLTNTKVAIINSYPGAPANSINAAMKGGYDGLVLIGMGNGNISPDMGRAACEALDGGMPIVVTTRVPNGEVRFVYGGDGGGATLGAHGAINSGVLRDGQARIALIGALATGTDPKLLFEG